MWWNMIGFHKDRATAIGYLWLEFGRIDDAGDPEYSNRHRRNAIHTCGEEGEHLVCRHPTTHRCRSRPEPR